MLLDILEGLNLVAILVLLIRDRRVHVERVEIPAPVCEHQAVTTAETAICVDCKRHVARWKSFTRGPVCANCEIY